MSNNGEGLSAQQLARSLVEHAPDALASLKERHATLTRELAEVERWTVGLSALLDRARDLIPNPGTIERE